MTSRVLGLVGQAALKWSRMVFFVASKVLSADVARGGGVLRYLNDFPETVAALPYSLWALPDCSWWLGWLVWLVRLWGTQKTRSPSLKISRNTIRVFVVAPPTADGAHGRVRTTLKSTVSSAYCSNDHWHTLGTQLDQIYG